MAALSAQDIEMIARQIAQQLGGAAAPAAAAPRKEEPAATAQPELGVYGGIDDAVKAAQQAFPKYAALSLQARGKIIAAIRKTMLENATALAKSAHEETGLGRFEDKIIKNQLVAEKTPGVEILTPEAVTGDHGLMLTEPAPFGVIGSITPCTNPTSTIINNAIAMIAAGNTVVFNPHPSAKKCSAETVALLNKVITANGGPSNVVVCVAQPTIESAGAMMKHPGIRLLVVTGGGGVVKAAMASGKRAICAGPGNPPVVVDETADIEKAARDIVRGASFDNNIICVEEKEVIVVASVADRLIKAMQQHDAVLIDKARLPQMEQTIFTKMAGPRGHAEINRAFIGKNAEVILSKMGMSVPSTVRLGIVEVEETHPLLWTEQMMPILPITRVPTADYAIDLAIEMEGHNRHTFIMHSKNLDNLSRMAKECNASIFVKNGPSQAGLGFGGEGCTSFTIASPTGEGLTTPRSFSRWRRCVLVDHFRIV
ncbi:MAG TPA: aldehyde dehydrogenase EutE [Kiritimatiellia bacterium]|nr:aldehyde dehydrogenase EutE [Kiritimatiellia bacterium]HRZ13620.1 aldehyde dehydrogenase EutE [Kiritimatiellia bacterium]HSA19284.1 aldehyde dehydrogenase EutE [Kiritimatiellia bacterium]